MLQEPFKLEGNRYAWFPCPVLAINALLIYALILVLLSRLSITKIKNAKSQYDQILKVVVFFYVDIRSLVSSSISISSIRNLQSHSRWAHCTPAAAVHRDHP